MMMVMVEQDRLMEHMWREVFASQQQPQQARQRGRHQVADGLVQLRIGEFISKFSSKQEGRQFKKRFC